MVNYGITQLNSMEKGIYIHIPFCISKCSYCDFLSFPVDDDTKSRYLEALCDEIRGFTDDGRSVATIFIGGGTPSTMPLGVIKRIMDVIYGHFEVKTDAEITIECNPGTITQDKLTEYKNCGINRLSIGLQSADNNELKEIGRIHTYEEFLESYRLARSNGFSNINIDLIFSLPQETSDKWRTTLKKVIELDPEHISAYSLIVEEGTPMYDKVNSTDRSYLPSEDEDRLMYHMTTKILGEAGYKRYEISNYAKEGYESRHNISYWIGIDYVGFGLGSASLINGKRYSNIRDMKNYLASPVEAAILTDELTLNDRMSEFMFLGLRLMSGVSEEDFRQRFNRNIDEIFGKEIKQNIERGLLIRRQGHIMLSRIGIDLSNTVMSDFIID